MGTARYARPMTRLRPVVLSGGSGTRLWPLSTPELPKQFVPLFHGRSLFDLTLSRLAGLPGAFGPTIVTGSRHVSLVERALAASAVEGFRIIVEPVGRNTAPAAFAAALSADGDDVLVIAPSDQLVSDTEAFQRAVVASADLADEGAIVAFGIEPSRPETGYGYIELGEPHDEAAYRIRRFREKPDLETATSMSGDGRHVWNSGMFVSRADSLLAQARRHCPQVLEAVEASMPPAGGRLVELGSSFRAVESISFDYAIMEKTAQALVLPIEVGWDDVGSYESLLAALGRDDSGNHVSGSVILDDVEGSFIWASSRTVAVAGMSDVVVVETEDAVLVLPIDRSQGVRDMAGRVDQV